MRSHNRQFTQLRRPSEALIPGSVGWLIFILSLVLWYSSCYYHKYLLLLSIARYYFIVSNISIPRMTVIICLVFALSLLDIVGISIDCLLA